MDSSLKIKIIIKAFLILAFINCSVAQSDSVIVSISVTSEMGTTFDVRQSIDIKRETVNPEEDFLTATKSELDTLLTNVEPPYEIVFNAENRFSRFLFKSNNPRAKLKLRIEYRHTGGTFECEKSVIAIYLDDGKSQFIWL